MYQNGIETRVGVCSVVIIIVVFGSIANMHGACTLLTDHIAAPMELASTVLHLHDRLETAPTAQRVTPTHTGGVGALAALRAHRARQPIHMAKVGRTLRVDNVLLVQLATSATTVATVAGSIAGHERLAAVVGDHLHGPIEARLESIGHATQRRQLPPTCSRRARATHSVAFALVLQVILHRLVVVNI